MGRRHGISGLLQIVLYTTIVVAAVGVTLNTAFPVITEFQDTGSIQNQITFLNDLDGLVQTVAAESRYSTRTTRITFKRGHFEYDNESDQLFYELKTNSPIISSHSSRMIGAVRLSANADVSVTETRINGTDCYLMENQRLEACVRAIDGFTASDNPLLEGYYRMDAGTGQTLEDSSTNGNDGWRGDTSSSEASDPAWGGGIHDDGLVFSSGDTATLPQSTVLESTLGTAPLTVAFWIRPSRDTSDWDPVLSWQTVNGSGDTHTARVEMMGGENDSLYTRFIADQSDCGDNTNDGGFWARNTDMGLTPGRWNLYAVTYNGTMITEYANGAVQETSADDCSPAALNGDLTINSLPNGHDIDEVRIYNRSLTQNEIAWMAQQEGDPTYMNTSELLVHYFNKDMGRLLDAAVTTRVNRRTNTSFGTGRTAVERTGSHLGSGQVTARVKSQYGLTYNLTFELLSGSDFLSIEAEKS